jgi:hypothetical protein
MRSQAARWSLALTLMACSPVLGQEPACCGPHQAQSHGRLSPAGGWHPYGGGLLHWWNPNCFPRCGAPDDYCRKPLPRVCWPPYSPYYTFGPPEMGYPPNNGFRDCIKSH